MLVVGLGNPGPEYAATPHNLGFRVAIRLSEDGGFRISRPECRSLGGAGKLEGQDVLVAMPLTYMNRSGGAIKELLAKYEKGRESLVVVFDELNLPFGS